MSRLLDKLKQAEEQRKRLLAGRKTQEDAEKATATAFMVAVPAEEIAVKQANEAVRRRDIERAGLEQAQARLAAETAAREAAERTAAADTEAVRLEKERRRLEARAGPPRASGRSRWLVLGAAAAAGIFAVSGYYGSADKKEAVAQGSPAGDFQLRLDRDLDSFSQRLREYKQQ